MVYRLQKLSEWKNKTKHIGHEEEHFCKQSPQKCNCGLRLSEERLRIGFLGLQVQPMSVTGSVGISEII